MTIAQAGEPTPRKPLRLWPGVAIVTIQWLLWLAAPLVVPEAGLISVIGGVLCGPVIVVWWLFFSRARWSERLGAIVLMVATVVATRPFLHKSIQNGNMGMMFPLYVIPGLCLALVAWAVASRRLSGGARRAALVAAILLACGAFMLLRTDGVIGTGSQLAWRWTPTPEERLLARLADEPPTLPAAPAAPETSPSGAKPGSVPAPAATEKAPAKPAADAAVATAKTGADWPGFRGPNATASFAA